MFTEKYKNNILGANNCIDRMIITGSLGPISYSKGLRCYLSSHGILIKNFVAYSKRLSELLKEYAKVVSKDNGIHYKYLDSPKIRKESVVKEIIHNRGDHPGLVAVLTTLEVDNSFDIQKDSINNKLKIVSRRRKCLHIYYYIIDEDLGLCYFRVQTFFPFKIQIYFNGHERLAKKLEKENILYEKDGNCFTYINDFVKAQDISDNLDITKLHSQFDKWVDKYVIILPELKRQWDISYHWSIKQIEYSKDIIFRDQKDLDLLYSQLLKQGILSALPEDVLSFLGRKHAGKQSGRIDTSCKKSYLGYRIKHRHGTSSIKMYNKSGNVLRIEIVINDITKIKVYRDVKKRNGYVVNELAPLKKSIHSLNQIIFFCLRALDRYLDFLSKLLNITSGIKQLRQITERITDNGKNYKGFNPLHSEDSIIFETLINGGSFIDGFTNKTIRNSLQKQLEYGKWYSSKVSRLLKRLQIFGLIKKISKSYKYILTEKGRLLVTLCLRFRNIVAIPTLEQLLKSLEMKVV